MGETLPPVSKSQPATLREADPHQSVTIAPPAPNVEELLRQSTPVPSSLSGRSDAHFRAALAAGSRAGSSLSDLSKIVSELTGGLSGARQANEQLVHELGLLRTMLGSANEQQLALAERVAELEQELVSAQRSTERERQFLTEQHDEFLAALLEEHEEALRGREPDHDATTRMGPEVSSLTQQLVQAESARLLAESDAAKARELLAKAQHQRDEAQARAEKRERERDELRAEASLLRARLGAARTASTAPPPPPNQAPTRPPSFGRLRTALTLDDGELDSNLHPRGATPRVPSVVPRFASPSGSSPTASSIPPATATPFPRETTRPGVGGPKPPALTPADFGPPPSGWTPPPPAPELEEEPRTPSVPRIQSAASLPQMPSLGPALKQKPDPTSRPLIDYSLGEGGVQSELLEGARLSSKPPKK